jgi:hypothetical protein
MSNSSIWIPVLAPITALLGAALGFAGAWIASRRATRTALQQALYSSQLKRQQDIFNTYFELVSAAHDELIKIAAVHRRPKFENFDDYIEAITEAYTYGPKHYIWFPEETFQKYRGVLMLIEAMSSELRDAATTDSVTDEEYKEVREKIQDRAIKEVNPALRDLTTGMMPVLGLKERGVFVLSEEAEVDNLGRPRQTWWRKFFKIE